MSGEMFWTVSCRFLEDMEMSRRTFRGIFFLKKKKKKIYDTDFFLFLQHYFGKLRVSSSRVRIISYNPATPFSRLSCSALESV